MSKISIRTIITNLILIGLVLGGCQPVQTPEVTPATSTREAAESPVLPTDTPAVKPTERSDQAAARYLGERLPAVPEYVEAVFASYQLPAVDSTTAIYQEPLTPDLEDVYNPFILSEEQLERLAWDGFVVTPGSEKEFFTLYEKARYTNVPIFVTSDSLLHSYHLLFDKVLRTAEIEYFIPLLHELNADLLQRAEEQYQALKGSAWEENARRVVAFVSVASKLLDPEIQVPEYAADLVEAELALIEDAGGILPSPLFPGLEFGEDYTQYIPRGHYTRSEVLKAYFKSMMWYGRMTFRLKTRDPEIGRDETRSALLLVYVLRKAQVRERPALEAWADLYNPTVFFVGRSDDLTVLQYIQVMDKLYGPQPTLAQLIDDKLLETFIEEANKLPPPKILGMVIQVSDDEEETTKGMRFMGQRFVPDAYVFRQLIYRNVGTAAHRRGLPKGLDLLAAMGSERAYQILDQMGDTQYEKYPQQMQKVRQWMAGLTPEEWTETLYNGWLYTFHPLLEKPGEGYPAFMQSQAWIDKQINTVLGSWAELKHDTILYAKQVYAEMGGGPPPPEPVPPRGYVEPVPEFYARLAALTAMTYAGLDSRGLLAEMDKANLQRLEELARSLQIMAEKELRGEPLSEAEFEKIRFYGGELEHLVMAAADSDTEDSFAPRFMEEEPQAAVVADVATDPDPDGDGSPNPVVLEEAVGRINEIHVVVPLIQEDGSFFLQVAKGGVFSYYEFPWPADDRLTDEKWHAMLDEGNGPPLPEWTSSFFISQGEYNQFQLAIHRFQSEITNQFWNVGFSSGEFPEGFEALSLFEGELDALRRDKQYVGRQLVRSRFSSFDLQSEDLAVVTVQETWLDKLYEGEFPEFESQPVSQRGPFALNATYTLQLQELPEGAVWVVSHVASDKQPPAWEKP